MKTLYTRICSFKYLKEVSLKGQKVSYQFIIGPFLVIINIIKIKYHNKSELSRL